MFKDHYLIRLVKINGIFKLNILKLKIDKNITYKYFSLVLFLPGADT